MCLINNILISLGAILSAPNLNVLSQICMSILISSGKITMLEISRYSQRSYRTIQRFFSIKSFDWLKLNCTLFQEWIFNKQDFFLLAADETVEPKAGKHTFGLARFFSNLQKTTVASVAFMSIGVVSVSKRKCFSLATQQVIKPAKEPKPKKESKPKKEPKPKKNDEAKTKKKPAGRPKGSKNKPKEVSKDVQYHVLDNLLKSVTSLLLATFVQLPCAYLLLDGYFGNQYYMRLAKQYKLHLISKLKSSSCLFLPYSGVYSGKGRPAKYGDKVNVKILNSKYLVETKTEEDYQYRFYQLQVWSKSYTDALLNVVVIISTNLNTKATAHCILFSTDLSLDHAKIVQYYGLRFQIEFNFRDAKQYFGLADFKNYKQTQLTNAVNLAFFLCNFSYIMIEHFKERFGLNVVSILDLKAFYRTQYIGNQCLELKNKPKKAQKYLTLDEVFQLTKKQSVNF